MALVTYNQVVGQKDAEISALKERVRELEEELAQMKADHLDIKEVLCPL